MSANQTLARAALVCLAAPFTLADDATSTLLSIGETNQQGSAGAGHPSFSDDGTRVAFSSFSGDLVSVDANGHADVFLRAAGNTLLVSLGQANVQGNQDVVSHSLSGDGGTLVWQTWASNLVPGDTNNSSDIFARDFATGQVTRVSVSSTGQQGNFHSKDPVTSTDGRYVAFASQATNLVPGDVGGATDVFLHDRQTGVTELVSITPSGGFPDGSSAAPAISPDGRFVAYDSFATDIVPGDTNGANDVFLFDRQTGTTVRLSVQTTGAQANGSSRAPRLTADVAFVAFESDAPLVTGDTNGVDDVYVVDTATGAVERISVTASGQASAGICTQPSISADGRFVAFAVELDDLDAADTNGQYDAYVKDRLTGNLYLRSHGPSGQLGNQGAGQVTLTPPGDGLAWTTNATNFVSPDLNGFEADVFLWSCPSIGEPYCEVEPNSTGSSAVTGATGSIFAVDQILTLTARELPPNQFGYFLAGMTQGFSPFAGGSQGHLCLAGTIGRFNASVASSGPSGSLDLVVDTQAIPTTPTQAILPGQTWNFQVWFRDANPQATSNFGLPVSVPFQ